jgi:hypothetical protein
VEPGKHWSLHLGENENQNHADVETGLLRCAANACVADLPLHISARTARSRATHDADGETSSETGETDREARAELDEAGVERHGRLHCAPSVRSEQWEKGGHVRPLEIKTLTTRPSDLVELVFRIE